MTINHLHPSNPLRIQVSNQKNKARNMHKSKEQSRHVEEEYGILIFDTGGGSNGTTKRRTWHVFEYKNHIQRLLGYQDKSEGRVYLIFNAVTKAWIQ